MSDSPTILLAGGGTGGHIFPNLAILHALQQRLADLNAHLLVSTRSIDRDILQPRDLPFTALPAQPMSLGRLPGFLRNYRKARRQTADLIDQFHPSALVATGGFVSAPAMAAAKKRGITTVLLNLDAVPGRANRLSLRWADKQFTTSPSPLLRDAETIGMPIRPAAIAKLPCELARQAFNLKPDLPTLLIIAGSQGATSINQMMADLCQSTQARHLLAGWQILHITGPGNQIDLPSAYEKAEIPAQALPFCQSMGLAWGAADLAISRAGAGSVAEIWANAVPTIFLPYPHHKDQHQRLNAQPLVQQGAAMLIDDRIDSARNIEQILPLFEKCLPNAELRNTMRTRLRASRPADGAAAVADWIVQHALPAPATA